MNKQTEATLNTLLDIAPADPAPETTVVPVTEVLPAVNPTATPVELTAEERQAAEDFQFSRGALKSVAVEAQNTLHRAVEVAEQVDSPRSFEAVAQMIRATLDSHKELHALHKTAAEIRATKTTTPASQVTIDKGIVFQGGADALLKLIDPSRK